MQGREGGRDEIEGVKREREVREVREMREGGEGGREGEMEAGEGGKEGWRSTKMCTHVHKSSLLPHCYGCSMISMRMVKVCLAQMASLTTLAKTHNE